MIPDLWQLGCERLASELPEQQFNTWIRPLPPASVEAQDDATTRVCVRVPNRFKLDWIRTQYAGRIEAVLSELAGHVVRLDLQLAPREAAPARAAATPAAANDETPAARAQALALSALATTSVPVPVPAPGSAAAAIAAGQAAMAAASRAGTAAPSGQAHDAG